MEQYNKDQRNQNTEPNAQKKDYEFDYEDKGRWSQGRVWAGLIVITVGSIWIAREAGADIPRWVTSWPMFLIAFGFFIGARHNFRNWFWLIPVGVGFALLADRVFFWDFDIKPFIWPTVIIIFGLFMIFRPKGRRHEQWADWRNFKRPETPEANEQDTIDAVSVFGSTKRNILSKDFRGGEVVNFFGGTELNLMQADITKPIVLDMVQVFGGAKLIVPSNWTIHTSEVVSVFGGVDDKRMVQTTLDPTKILILRGTNVFGGLEIKSY